MEDIFKQKVKVRFLFISIHTYEESLKKKSQFGLGVSAVITITVVSSKYSQTSSDLYKALSIDRMVRWLVFDAFVKIGERINAAKYEKKMKSKKKRRNKNEKGCTVDHPAGLFPQLFCALC